MSEVEYTFNRVMIDHKHWLQMVSVAKIKKELPYYGQVGHFWSGINVKIHTEKCFTDKPTGYLGCVCVTGTGIKPKYVIGFLKKRAIPAYIGFEADAIVKEMIDSMLVFG